MKTFLTSLFMVIAFSALSQSSMEPGYVVLNSGDTLRGEIEDRDWKVSPSYISFKPSGETATVKYSSLQVKSFFLTSETALFQSFRMTVNQAPADPKRITESNYNAKAEKSFFARVLVRGLVSLYYMYDFKTHYIIEKQGNVQELIIQHNPTKVNTNAAVLMGTNVKRESVNTLELYKGQLNAIFLDCKALEKKVWQIPFRTEKLKSIVIAYNNCKDDKVQFVQKDDGPRTEVGIVAGVSITSNAIQGTVHPYMVNATYAPAINPTAGIFVNYLLAKNKGRYAWYNELSFVKFNSESDYEEDNVYTLYYKNHSVFSYLQLFTGARVRYNQSKTRPFFGFGLSASYAMSGEFYTIQERYLNGVFVDSRKIDFDPHTFSFGLWAEAGLALGKRFDVQVKLHKNQGYSNAATYKSIVMHYFLTLGYRFGRQEKR